MILLTKITPELAEETGWHIEDGSRNIYNHKDGKQRGLYQLGREKICNKFMKTIQSANPKFIVKYQKFLNSKGL